MSWINKKESAYGFFIVFVLKINVTSINLRSADEPPKSLARIIFFLEL